MDDPHTITITPIVRESVVREYAEKYQCKNPWDHIAGRLLALDEMSHLLDMVEENLSFEDATDGEIAALKVVRQMRQLHRQASQEMHSFFGEEERT